MRPSVFLACALFIAVLLPEAAQGQRVRLVRAFAPLVFDAPLVLAQSPGDVDRYYVAEQGGRVRTFSRGDATSSVFLDISDRVLAGGERGLLGLAFHPGYPATAQVYVCYTGAGGDIILARFAPFPGGAALDPASEEVVLSVPHGNFANHNGGTIGFGPDGYLYVGLGDGGGASDPLGNGQNPGTLLGAMLRLDVDTPGNGTAYSIPADNPYAGSPGCGPDTPCPEIYAHGLRNPWKWSFDPATGELWTGDVGQGSWEEVDVVRSGDNLGWACMEGLHVFAPQNCDPAATYAPPVAEYAHEAGRCSVTGGYVARSPSLRTLEGAYIYADYCTGELFGLFPQLGGGYASGLIGRAPYPVASFARDAAGEMYVLSITEGVIHRLSTPTTTFNLPVLLDAGPQAGPGADAGGRVRE